MEWLKKNLVMVVINFIISILLVVVAVGLNRAIANVDSKADKVTVSNQFKIYQEKINTVDTRITAVDKKVDAVKTTTDEKLELILLQISALRQDLRLKEDKLK